MDLPAHAVVLVLLAAIAHAGWNAAVKIGGDRLVVLAVINGVGAVVGLAMVPWIPFPAAGAWPYLLASVLIHTLYYLFLVLQYRVGDLSHVYPLARGLSPVMVACGAMLVADEQLPAPALGGLLLASVGITSLAFEGGAPWRRDARPALYATGTATLIASYTLVDGLGVRLAGEPLSYVAWLFLLDGIPIAALAFVRRRRQVRTILSRDWRESLLGGGMQIFAYGVVIWAMSRGPMAQVSALRETSVIFAALFGVRVLREPLGARRILAATTVAVGLIIMNSWR